MPISPEKMALYPGGSITSPAWRWIVALVSVRSANACEFCKVRNGAIIHRSKDRRAFLEIGVICGGSMIVGDSYDAETGEPLGCALTWDDEFCDSKPVKVVLTVAHLDHDTQNNAPNNLAHLCQMHHNRHDKDHRKKNAAARRRAGLKIGELNLKGDTNDKGSQADRLS